MTGSNRSRPAAAGISAEPTPRVVILGGGFGGLRAARRLEGEPVEVLLVDRNNYHAFLPLLYQVAAAELHPQDIAYPLRTLFARSPNVRVRIGEATRIDLAGSVVEVGGQAERFDYLILATGSTTHFFGVAGAERNGFALKTIDEALALRNHVLSRFERATRLAPGAERAAALAFVVVGGGATGVEFAGALAELVHGPLAKDFAEIDPREVRVVIVEATERVLVGLPERLAAYTLERLASMEVEVLLGTPVRSVTERGVELASGAFLAADTVVWTAGVRGALLEAGPELPQRGGRVLVRETLQTEVDPSVYVVGELARVDGTEPPHPQVAQVAIQQGALAAENVLRAVRGEQPAPFRYRDLGTMVAIGRNHGVARVFGRGFTGFPAWVLWSLVHIAKLVGVRNRLFVLVSWAWNYLFFEHVARLIVPRERRKDDDRGVQDPGP